MRSRRKPWANAYLQSLNIVSFDPTLLKQEWTLLSKGRPICLELGSGKGDYVFSMAQKYPEYYWIAVEKDENVAATALKKQDEPLENVFWIVADAKDMRFWFEANSIEKLYLNFSDPWPKKHHAKRRLSSDSFVLDMLAITRAEALFHLKTDNQKLFEYTLLLWENYPLKLSDFSVDYRRDDHPEDALTEYEQRFIALNQPIYRAVWRKI